MPLCECIIYFTIIITIIIGSLDFFYALPIKNVRIAPTHKKIKGKTKQSYYKLLKIRRKK